MISMQFSVNRAVKLVDEMEILTQWMREDVLGKVGTDYNERYMLFSFVLSELKAREPMAEKLIKPLHTKLENQRDDLLAFVQLIDDKLKKLAVKFKVSLPSIRSAYQLQAISLHDYHRYSMEEKVRKELGESFHLIQQELIEIIDDTIRASSIVENVNSRLRPYFFLRKQLNDNFLELLKFYLNHKPYERSARPERVGKSPAELLAGKKHDHL